MVFLIDLAELCGNVSTVVLICYIDDRWPCQWQVTNSVKAFLRTCNVTERESDLQSPLQVASKFLQDQGVRDSQNENPIIDPRHEWSLSVWNLVDGTRSSTESPCSWTRKGEGSRPFSVSSVRKDSSFVTDQEFTATSLIIEQLKS